MAGNVDKTRHLLRTSKFECNRKSEPDEDEFLITDTRRRHFANALQATKYTYRTEGLRGFWAGKIQTAEQIEVV